MSDLFGSPDGNASFGPFAVACKLFTQCVAAAQRTDARRPLRRVARTTRLLNAHSRRERASEARYVAGPGTLSLGRVVPAAHQALCLQVVDLAFVGMQQHGPAIPAGKIKTVIACFQDGRGARHGPGSGRRNDLE